MEAGTNPLMITVSQANHRRGSHARVSTFPHLGAVRGTGWQGVRLACRARRARPAARRGAPAPDRVGARSTDQELRLCGVRVLHREKDRLPPPRSPPPTPASERSPNPSDPTTHPRPGPGEPARAAPAYPHVRARSYAQTEVDNPPASPAPRARNIEAKARERGATTCT